MSDALDGLIEILDLEPIEVNIFRGRSPAERRQRVFGGQVAGQALVAAGRTVVSEGDERRPVHSLHAYFLRPGDPTVPILYEVDRIRDGRSFTTRRVVAIQHGAPIFHLSASFQVIEPGFEHTHPAMPDAPDPLSLPDFKTRMEPYKDLMGDWFSQPRPIDSRYIGEFRRSKPTTPREPRQQLWMRADGSLPDDPLLHACVVAYASDMTLIDTTLLPHTHDWDEQIMMASIDHAMWFHHEVKADDWLLYDLESPSASNARGLAIGRIYTQSGQLAVSVVQEGLIRPMGPR